MDTTEFNLEGEIIKAKELILKLNEAEKSSIREKEIIEKKMFELHNRMNGAKHQIQINIIEALRYQFCRLMRFPDCGVRWYCTLSNNEIQAPDVKKELGDSIQRSKNRFQHLSGNLATERKMAKELQQLENQWKEQPDVNLVKDDTNRYYRRGLMVARFERIQALPHMPLRDLIEVWAEEADNVGRLVLRDTRKMKETRKTYENLAHLDVLGNRMYWKLNIGKAEFNKHWDSRKMKCIKNSINQIDLDLVKETRYHTKRYAKSERNKEEAMKLGERSSELCNELIRIRHDKSLATSDLVKLHEKQACLEKKKKKSKP